MMRFTLACGVLLAAIWANLAEAQQVLPGSYVSHTVGSMTYDRDLNSGRVWHSHSTGGARIGTLIYPSTRTVLMHRLGTRGGETPLSEGAINFRLNDPLYYSLIFASREAPQSLPGQYDIEFSLNDQTWTLADSTLLPELPNAVYPGHPNHRLELFGLLEPGDHTLKWRATNSGPNAVATLQLKLLRQIPEPATCGLLALGLTGVVVARRWQRVA